MGARASSFLCKELDEFFKFAVGDSVTLIQGGFGTEYEYAGFKKRPTRILVLERVLRECSGGIQKFYVVRLFGPQGPVNGEFHEMELEPWIEPATEAAKA